MHDDLWYNAGSMRYPGTVWRPQLSRTPEDSLARLCSSPDAVAVLWKRAVSSLTFDANTGGQQPGKDGGGEYVYEDQPGDWRVIISNSTAALRRFHPEGTWEAGTVTVGFDPQAMPLGSFDRLTPLSQEVAGQTWNDCPGVPRGTWLSQKETVKRGGAVDAGAGKVAITGTAVVGAGTAFTSFFSPGDLLTLRTGFVSVVSAVADDTHLTLAAPSPFAYAATDYSRGRERLLYSPAFRVTLARTASQDYAPGTEVAVSQDGEYLTWPSPGISPAAGQPISLIYDYYPQYQITDLSQRPPIVGGRSGLAVTTGTLYKPEHTAS